MAANHCALGIRNAHVQVNAVNADRACKAENFMPTLDRGVSILARKSQYDGAEATDATKNNPGGDVFLLRDRFQRLAKIDVRGQAESEGLEGTAGIHVHFIALELNLAYVYHAYCAASIGIKPITIDPIGTVGCNEFSRFDATDNVTIGIRSHSDI
jgi:hypothetical protein